MTEKILNNLRILVVDDDEVILNVFSSIMRQAGYHTDFFLDPQQALSTLASHPLRYDILVVDIHMPGQDGISLARKVREMLPDLPVMFMTGGDVTEEKKEEALALGRVRFLPKPFPLIDALTEMVSKFALEKKPVVK